MPIGRDSIEVKRCNERNKFTDVVKLDDDGRCERCRLDEGGDAGCRSLMRGSARDELH